jgi:hypothetical protein
MIKNDPLIPTLIFNHFRFRHPVSGKKSVPDRPSSADLRKTSPTSDDVPSYMRSTSASIKKERQTAPQSMTREQRRRSSVGMTQSTNDLRSVAKDVEEDSSSEENLTSGRTGSRRRSSSSGGGSQDRYKFQPGADDQN